MKKKNLISTLTSTLFLLSFLNQLSGQMITANPTIPASSIDKQSLEISNDLFNGKVNISIPVYQYNFEGISFPISLTYASGNGIKPDELPSWVGSGWNLNGGGFIHRTVRGKPDEALDFKKVIWNWAQTFNRNAYVEEETILNGDYSYFSNYFRLANSIWHTSANAASASPPIMNYPEVNSDNYLTRQTYNSYPVYDLSPDEYTFSFGNSSGKFYLNHLKKWVVTVNDGKQYDIHVETGEQEVVNKTVVNGGITFKIYYVCPRVIKYFTMTSSDGIRYFFGSTDLNLPLAQQCFDYSHGSVVQQVFVGTGLLMPNLQRLSGFDGPTYVEITPHTWHLTKVENLKTGSVITFNYKQQGIQVSKTNQAWGNGGPGTTGGHVVFDNTGYFPRSEDGDVTGPPIGLSAIAKVATSNWTLTSINFPNNIKLDFNSIASTQQSTNLSVENDAFCGFGIYPDMYYRNKGNYTLLQLNNISVLNNNVLVKEFDFDYGLSGSQRLELKSFKENAGGTFTNEHKFDYKTGTIVLPPYGSRKKDHWGFYNGLDYVEVTSNPQNYSSLSGYSATRNPNSIYSDAEILTKITYPTGGQVVFEYEPHDYSKKKNRGDFTITSDAANLEAGGVRIKKIRYFTDDIQLKQGYEKEFSYKIPGTSLSSGILSQPPPDYEYGGNFNAEGFTPVYSDGNHITYTYVTEKQAGKGSVINTYSNYDNGYNDELAKGSNLSGSATVPYGYSNKSYKRGKIKNSKIKDESDITIKEIQYKYADEDETGQPEIRSLHIDPLSTQGLPGYTSVVNLVYNDNITENTTINNSTVGSLTTVAKSEYDLFGNLKESKFTDSKGNIIKKKFKYAYEYPVTGTDAISLGVNQLIEKKCGGYLVEEIDTKEDAGGNEIVTGGTLYTYKSTKPFIDKVYKLAVLNPIAFSSFVQSHIDKVSNDFVFVKDSHYPSVSEITYDLYDSKGNILQTTSKSGIVQSTLWGYNDTYPVARVIGAEYSTVYSLINPFLLQNPSDEDGLNAELKRIRVGLAGTEAQVFTSTYLPLIGVSSETDINGNITYHRYDRFGRLTLILDKEGNVLKKTCYNFAGEIENCDNIHYGNVSINGLVFKNDCPPGKIGTPVHPNIAAGTYFSEVGTAFADDKARQQAQVVANQLGRCIDPIYGRIEFIPTTLDGYTNPGETYSNQYAEVWIKFYSDYACTHPLTLTSNININYTTSNETFYPTSYDITLGGATVIGLTGTNGILITEASLLGQWQLLDENGNETYFERWNQHFDIDLVTSDCSGAPYFSSGITFPSWY